MISCACAEKDICAGETAVCLLRGVGDQVAEYLSKYENSIVFAQVHGHVSADVRWLKTTTKLADVFADLPSVTIDHVQNIAANPAVLSVHYSTHCIFMTNKIAVAPSHIFDGGVFLEFEMPKDALSSFKGLCGSISYYISVSIQHTASTEVFNFPLAVRGSGSARSPYELQHSSLVSYPASSLPVEILLSAPTIASSYGNQSEAGDDAQERKEVSNVYMVRDREHICDLHLSSASLRPGRDVEVHLDFNDSRQPCSMVRATLVLSETRPDGSRIQDKVISKAIRTAIDAEYLNMVLNIPTEMPCSFDTPLFTVEYRIDLDFCLDLRRLHKEEVERLSQEGGSGKGSGNSNSPVPAAHSGGGVFDEAFSFSIPLKVVPGGSTTGSGCDSVGKGKGGLGREGSSIVAVQQRALKCLASTSITLPI